MLNGRTYLQTDLSKFADSQQWPKELGGTPVNRARWPSGYVPGGHFLCCNNRVNKSREQRTSNRLNVIPVAKIEIVSGRSEDSCGCETVAGLIAPLIVRTLLAQACRCDFVPNKIVLRKGARGISPQLSEANSID